MIEGVSLTLVSYSWDKTENIEVKNPMQDSLQKLYNSK